MKTLNLNIENKDILKRVIPKYPDLMSEDIEDKIKTEYQSLVDIKTQLHSARDLVRKLENDYTEKQKYFKDLDNLFEFEFESEEIEIQNTKCGVMVKGHGNSTLGITTLM